MLHNDVLSEDITQFCFMKIWEHRSDIHPDENFAAYLYTIARNAVYKETRRSITSAIYIDHVINTSPKSSDTTYEQVNYNLLQKEITEFIESLPESRKKIYRLSTQEHLSNEEIAEMLNISVNTVKTQIWRVTSSLKKHLSNFFTFFLIML